MKERKGISLIVLVITIIVIIILAGTVILSLASNNPISASEEAVFKSDLNEYNSELSLALANEYLSEYEFDSATINESTVAGIRTYITSMPATTDEGEYEIQAGKLVYTGSDTNKQTWAEEALAGAIASVPSEPETTGLAIDTIATVNSCYGEDDASSAAYDNPVIPVGFKAVNTSYASWDSMEYNKGLVIEDGDGNQFVWVPVDGTIVSYTKDLSYPRYSGTDPTGDDTLPRGVTSEETQITNYGGFYIARYEAGNASNVLVSKAGATVWNYINYTDSKTKAERMYNNANYPTVKSGLLTGKMWDATMDFAVSEGKSVTDSREWGNYSDSTGDAATDSCSNQVSGHSEYWKTCNIYDIAGNVWEWTTETYSSYRISRGGYSTNSGSSRPASYRGKAYMHGTFSSVGFRVVLYIL